MVQFKNSIFVAMFSFAVYAVSTLRWYLYGFRLFIQYIKLIQSLSFSETSGNPLIGNFRYAAGANEMLSWKHASPVASTVPTFAFMLFYGTTLAVAVVIFYGSVAERTRAVPFLIFSVLWGTLVFDPVTYWSVNDHGWLFKMKVLDFAGGLNVHVCAGGTALALALAVKRRNNPQTKPHNLPLMTIGVMLCWFGWLFLNGGSAFAMDHRAMFSVFNTNIAGCSAIITWLAIDHFTIGKFTSVGLMNAIFAGLVTITPASGYIYPHFAVLFGICGASVCKLALMLKEKIGYDDTLDVVAVHGFSATVNLHLLSLIVDWTHIGWSICFKRAAFGSRSS